MVFKHNKQPCDGDDTIQLASKHTSEVDYTGQFASSAYMENELIPDGVWPGRDLKFDKMTAVSPNDNSGIALGSASDLSLTMSSNGGSVRLENWKRPIDDDQSCQLGCKRTRQLETDRPSSRSTCQQSYNFVTADEEFKSRKEPVAPEDSTKNSHGSIYSFPWFTCSRSEEDMRLETPIRLSFYPGYYEDYHEAAESDQLDEIHSPTFDYQPRKPVSLGQNHQADIPNCRSKCFRSLPGGSDGNEASTSSRNLLIDENDTDRWIECCVMPIPDSNSMVSEGLVGRGKIDCFCLDESSVRCVRHHVAEAREKLRVSMGHERFVQLGFCDMGEDVARKWSEEEEDLFHEVIASNPASLGKNFWDVLPLAFPSRSSKELVSYYFNVFMLRKRAEQNRSDPLNVDSDNDEWQDSEDGEFGTTEEDDDEDSGVESPAHDVLQNIGGHGEVDIHEEAEGVDCNDEEYDISNGFAGRFESTFSSHVHPISKSFRFDSAEDQDVHDDSCTSYEDQNNRVDSHHADLECSHNNLLEDDHANLHAEYRNDGMSSMADHGYMVGECDPKSWDVGYVWGVEKDVDFLPTCNVIEEVFGHESWDNKTREGHETS